MINRLLWFDHEERLSELDGVAVLDAHLGDGARLFCFDLVEDFHRFDQADDGVGADGVSDIDERGGVWVRFGVVGADHRGFDGDESGVGLVGGCVGVCGRGGRGCLSGCGRGCGCGRGGLVDDGLLIGSSFDGDGFGLVAEVELGEFVFDHEFDEFFELADVDHVEWIRDVFTDERLIGGDDASS